MSSERVLKQTRVSQNFCAKATMMQLSIIEQVDLLNKMYDGKLVFGDNPRGIIITHVDKDLISIELPEVDKFDMGDLLPTKSLIGKYFGVKEVECNVVSIVLPKCLDHFHISRRCSWQNYIQRIFVWDTTDLTMDEDGAGKYTDMVIIKSTTRGKAKVIKL